MSSSIEWNAIRSDYESGMSLRQLAAKYGISKSVIGERKHKEQWDQQQKKTHPPERIQPDTGHRTPDSVRSPKKEHQYAFLVAYAEHANVLLAARQAGVARRTVYDWLEHDEDFSFAYNLAKEDAKDVLRAEIYRRAVEGWEEPLVSAGKLMGKVRKYDTTLLIFHSKMLMPEYRDKSQVDLNATSTTTQDTRVLQDAIMQALTNHPEARVAVAEALMEKSRERQR